MTGRFNFFGERSVRCVGMAGQVSLTAGLLTLAATVFVAEFGFAFNYTHSAPFGIYRKTTEPATTAHIPAPYVFFCPDVRWPAFKGQPNYRKPLGSCPDGFTPLIKPVVAWPGDIVQAASSGLTVNGHLLSNTQLIARDSAGHEIHPFPAGTYRVAPGQLWVVSVFSPKSFDSRYFGPIPISSVRMWLRPFVVEKSYQPENRQ